MPGGSHAPTGGGGFGLAGALAFGEGGVRGTGLPSEKTNPGLEWLDQPKE